MTNPPCQYATTRALLHTMAEQYGDKPFIWEARQQWSFAKTLSDVQALAGALANAGFTRGDRAAIWAPNCGEWIVAALATQYLGGTVVTLNTRYKGAEAAQIINQSGACVLFVVNQFLDTDYPSSLREHKLAKVAHEIVITLSNQEPEPSNSYEQWLQRGRECLAETAVQERLTQAGLELTAHTPSDILFTSGTTGRAKGVVTHHEQNLRAFAHFAQILGLNDEDRYLIINPFFHSFGYKAGWLAALMSGATVYPMPVFNVSDVLAYIEAHQITVMPGPPTLFQSILSHPNLTQANLRSLTKATTGAASIPTQLIVDMVEILGIGTVLSAYGLSESCGLVTMCRPGDAPETIATTSGRAIPDIEVAIMDPTGALLPPDHSGEIVVRGFTLMAEYLDQPEATLATIDAQGWLHTGDIGVLDDAGNLRITDRLKDMFISGGFNCYPAEIENQLLGHPDIAQAAVIGIPDERLGEVGAAFVVPNAGAQLTDDTLVTWSREHIANYKVPRRFFIVDALPLNASGKVMKTELRERLAKQHH